MSGNNNYYVNANLDFQYVLFSCHKIIRTYSTRKQTSSKNKQKFPPLVCSSQKSRDQTPTYTLGQGEVFPQKKKKRVKIENSELKVMIIVIRKMYMYMCAQR